MASSMLYWEYSRLLPNPVVDRAYRNCMIEMVELGLVKVGRENIRFVRLLHRVDAMRK